MTTCYVAVVYVYIMNFDRLYIPIPSALTSLYSTSLNKNP